MTLASNEESSKKRFCRLNPSPTRKLEHASQTWYCSWSSIYVGRRITRWRSRHCLLHFRTRHFRRCVMTWTSHISSGARRNTTGALPVSALKRMTDLAPMQAGLKKLRDTLKEYHTVQ